MSVKMVRQNVFMEFLLARLFGGTTTFTASNY